MRVDLLVIAALAIGLAVAAQPDSDYVTDNMGPTQGAQKKEQEPKVTLPDYFPCHEPTGATPGMRF